jgi:cell division protein FtsW (lipid II flippase)
MLLLYAVALTVSPAARERSWDVDYRWSHWAGYLVWLVLIIAIQFRIRHILPDSDPYLLPVAALLTGWGLLTIYRLLPGYGLRQTLWLAFSGAIILLGLRLEPSLNFLRRYKYLWLTGGLLLTALTLILGTNPTGAGPRMWLGCCGVYFQPSEPLKLLLVIYLAAYFSELIQIRSLPPLAPTLVVIGATLLLMLVQRDLGTASIFFFLYAVMLYLASGRKRILLISLVGLALAGLAGYYLFDVVRLRVDAWLNPWLDPSGRSYQIVQSLLAIASGGIGGRGPGLGSPGLVPVSISDFIFSAIAEETGLAGTLGLFALLGIFTARGLNIALHAPDRFRRLLAAGLTAYIGAQSILIIGGTIRLLPLTGVTLPFVSYGGSSLLTSFIATLLLLLISSQIEAEPAPLHQPQPYWILGGLLITGFLFAALVNGWWAVVRGPDLLTRTDNARRTIADRYVLRGALLDRNNSPINISEGESGGYIRVYQYPNLAPVIGYTNPFYGQAGLEASLDPYLRGTQGNPNSLVWWNHLLYGQPPPGLDVRLSIDLNLQTAADSLLGNHTGAVVLINAKTGEILVMASHPTYNPNQLDEIGAELLQDPQSPLLNRAAQGLYPPGEIWTFIANATGRIDKYTLTGKSEINLELGFSEAPQVRLQVAPTVEEGQGLKVSPLQMVVAAAALSHEGTRPAPRLALAVDTPTQGWVVVPPLGEPKKIFLVADVEAVTQGVQLAGKSYWLISRTATDDGQSVTWALAGTPTTWGSTPLTVVVLLEENNPILAEYIAGTLLETAQQP